MAVVGEVEVAERTLAVRSRHAKGEIVSCTVDDLIEQVLRG